MIAAAPVFTQTRAVEWDFHTVSYSRGNQLVNRRRSNNGSAVHFARLVACLGTALCTPSCSSAGSGSGISFESGIDALEMKVPSQVSRKRLLQPTLCEAAFIWLVTGSCPKQYLGAREDR